MQYSPENNIPYIGLVDAGTVELVRKLKKKVVSSADLVQKFEASVDAEQLRRASRSRPNHRPDHAGGVRARGRLRAASASRSPNWNCSNGFSNSFAQNGLTTADRRSPPCSRTTATRTTSRSATVDGRFARATCCCSTSGQNSTSPEASTTTLLGWATWARACRTPTRKYSASCAGARRRGGVREGVRWRRAADSRLGSGPRGTRSDLAKAGTRKISFTAPGTASGREVHGNGANMDSLETRDDRRDRCRTRVFRLSREFTCRSLGFAAK